MTRDPRGRYDSQGRRMLLRLLQHMTAAAVARECRTDRRTISALATGAHAAPSLAVALALEPLGISARSWLEAPGETIATPVDTQSDKVTTSKPRDPRAA